MGYLRHAKLVGLSKYSWMLLIAFICAVVSMHHGDNSQSLRDLVQTFPLITAAIYFYEKYFFLIIRPESSLNKAECFGRDVMLLSFSFLLGCLISLVFSYHNSDARGWWPLIIYFFTAYGIVFSIVFSLIALLIKNHKTYTISVSSAILLLISFGAFFPRYISILYWKEVDTLYFITSALLVAHLLLAIILKIINIALESRKR